MLWIKAMMQYPKTALLFGSMSNRMVTVLRQSVEHIW